MPLVFIIHAPADDATVDQIRDTLSAAGIDAWVDHLDCQGSRDSWAGQNKEALKTCQHGVFVLSAQSANLSELRNECQAILDAGKRLHILSVESVPLDDFPDQSYMVQYIDLTRDYESNIGKLIQSIKQEYNLDEPPPLVNDHTVYGPFPRWYLHIRLIGRDAELSAVLKSLADGHRVIAILGLSGIGKTRLAAEVVSKVSFQHGIIWHKLSEYSTVADLTMQIRNHLGLDATADIDSVWRVLGHRQVLLVLDDAEECTQRQAYADRLNVLDLSGGTRVLMTSRQRWTELHDVKFHELRTPELNTALLILRAMVGREPPAFSIQEYEEELVRAARCRPKLIWYAVRWADAYPPDYVLEILKTRRGADAEKAYHDLITRTIRLAEQHEDWPEALNALRRLAVTRGGFTFDAARSLIGEPRPLVLLKGWGLVSLHERRYAIDPLLLPSIDVDESAYPAHFAYYLTLAEQCDVRQDYLTMEIEASNLVAAFEWAISTDQLEQALKLANACSEFLANRGLFDQRKTWYERIAAKLLRQTGDRPRDRLQAMVQVGLGVAYHERQVGDRRTNLLRAVSAFDRAMQFFTPRRAPLEFAMIQNNLGIAYRNLAELEKPADHLRMSIAAFERTVRCYTPQNAPLEFAAAQNNLGATYINLARIENRKDNLWRAMSAFRRALAILKPEVSPIHCALTHNNLGIAYAELVDTEVPEKRVPNVKKAINEFQLAMRFLTPERAPMHYARALNNLGHAYRNLAELYGEPDNLRLAIAAYSRALRFWTAQTVPLHHAATQTNLGYACLELARMENEETNLQRAADALRQALYFYSPRRNVTEYIKIKVTLGIIHKMLKDMESAIKCWEEAESYFRSMGMSEMSDRMRRWITGETDPSWTNRIRY